MNLNKFWNWVKNLFHSYCSKCNKKGVSYSHTQDFAPGKPEVYQCKYCKNTFI